MEMRRRIKKSNQIGRKRRGHRKQPVLAVFMLLSLLFTLYGCEAKKDSGSVEEDLQSLETSESSSEAEKVTSGGLKGQLHIPEEIHFKGLNDKGTSGAQVDCPVDAPISVNPSIYQQKKRPFSKEEIIKKAENLFDEGKFTYVKPLDCYTLDELNEEYDELQRLQKKAKKEGDAEQWDYSWNRSEDVAFYKEFFDEKERKEFQEGDFTEGGRLSFYDRVMIMEGEVEGKIYHLLAFTTDGHNYLKLCKRSRGYGSTREGLNNFGYPFKRFDNEGNVEESDEVSEGFSLEEESSGRMPKDDEEPTQQLKKQYSEEDVCSYSEEEAGKLALQYAALLGDTDMAIAKTNWCYRDRGHRAESGEEEEVGIDLSEGPIGGYAFYLQRKYGELLCNESNYWWREAVFATDKERAAVIDPSGIVAEQECYRVVVTDEGVVFVDTIEPWYEVTSTVSDSASLMDFQEIEKLAQEYFEEKAERNAAVGMPDNIIRITEVKLRYTTLCYDGEYTLIPCWYFNDNGLGGIMNTRLVINAIDGTEVYMCRRN